MLGGVFTINMALLPELRGPSPKMSVGCGCLGAFSPSREVQSGSKLRALHTLRDFQA
jgi:hypothetical protein